MKYSEMAFIVMSIYLAGGMGRLGCGIFGIIWMTLWLIGMAMGR
jgi:hypothetical protein